MLLRSTLLFWSINLTLNLNWLVRVVLYVQGVDLRTYNCTCTVCAILYMLHPCVHAHCTCIMHIQFCGMMDLLSLPAAIARSQCSASTGEEEGACDTDIPEEGEDEEDSQTLETLLLLSWKRLQHLLGCTFDEALQLKDRDSYHIHCLELLHKVKKPKQFEKGRKVDLFSTLCGQFSRTMSTLLTAANKEELQVILKQLLSIKVYSGTSLVWAPLG